MTNPEDQAKGFDPMSLLYPPPPSTEEQLLAALARLTESTEMLIETLAELDRALKEEGR